LVGGFLLEGYMLEVPNHTQIPNAIIDGLMSKLSHAQFKVLIAICRKTLGWHKQSDYISISQIMNLTSVSNKTVVRTIRELEDMKLITTKKTNRKPTHITINYKVTSVVSTQDVKPTSVVSTQDEPKTSVLSTHTKEILKENIYTKYVDLWNEVNGTDLRITNNKRKQIKARLKTFSEQEIINSIKNRSVDQWINGDGKKFKGNWDSFWRNDEKVERYLKSDQKDSWESQGYESVDIL
jgi:phage replication O-like protein O